VAKKSLCELLPPNEPEGFHRRRDERIAERTLELGRGKFLDILLDCQLSDCELRILGPAKCLNLRGSTLERCLFRPRKQLRNHRFTNANLRDCKFLGKYRGCRFGRELDDRLGTATGCDFSQAVLWHLCDFWPGAEVETFRLPPWPHVLVTDLPRSRADWLGLKLPPELRIVQEGIGAEDSLAHAVSLYLPAVSEHFLSERAEELRELFSSRSYLRFVLNDQKKP